MMGAGDQRVGLSEPAGERLAASRSLRPDANPPTVREAPSEARRRRVWQAAVAIAVCYSALHLGYSVGRYNVLGRGSPDGLVYGMDMRRAVDEAREWRATGALNFRDVIYPPLYYALLTPLTGLEFRSVERIFYLAQFLLFPLAIFFLVHAAWLGQRPPPMAYLLAAVLAINFQPFLETLALYKVEGIEFVLICWALYAFRKRRDAWAGVAVFLAANLKYLPGILIVYFAVKREFRVLAGVFAAFAVSLLVLIPLFGAGTIWRYYTEYPLTMLFAHQLQGTGAEASFEFQTLTGTVNRWFAGFQGMLHNLGTQSYAPVRSARAAFLIAGALKLALLGSYLWLIRNRWPREERETRWLSYLWECSLTLILLFVLIPVSLLHYAILLLPAFVATGLVLYQFHRIVRARETYLFALAYLLTGMILPGGLWNRVLPPHPLWGAHHTWVYFWFSFPFYGYALLGLCILLCSRRIMGANGRS